MPYSIQSSLKSYGLESIDFSRLTEIKPTQIDNIYYTIDHDAEVMLLLLGSSEECTTERVGEFARIYSLPTPEDNSVVNQFRRYSQWLGYRNGLIEGFTEHYDRYYMVADRCFSRCYSRYGFCTACGILRCSPVWCICGHKELSDGWTSNNKQLDEFIKKTQLQTNSANHAYLEWIPYYCIHDGYGVYLNGLTTFAEVKLIPLEITDETHDSYYTEVNYLLMHHVYCIV